MCNSFSSCTRKVITFNSILSVKKSERVRISCKIKLVMINENSFLLLTSSLFLSFFSLNLSHFFSLNNRRSHSYTHFFNQFNINDKKVVKSYQTLLLYSSFLESKKIARNLQHILFILSTLSCCGI